MFDLGFWELVLITIVALLVVGPEKLPGLARQIGLWVGKAKRFVNGVRADIEREINADELRKTLNEQKDEILELKGMITEAKSDVKAELQETDYLVKSIEDELVSKPYKGQSTDGNTASDVTAKHESEQSSGH